MLYLVLHVRLLSCPSVHASVCLSMWMNVVHVVVYMDIMIGVYMNGYFVVKLQFYNRKYLLPIAYSATTLDNIRSFLQFRFWICWRSRRFLFWCGCNFFLCVYFIGEPEINRRNGSSCYRDRGGQIYVAACFRIAVRGWLDILTVERNFIYWNIEGVFKSDVVILTK